MIAEKYVARPLLSLQEVAQSDTLGKAYWLSGTENPADGLAKRKCDTVPFSPLMRLGPFFPEAPRPSKEEATWETPAGVGERGGQ